MTYREAVRRFPMPLALALAGTLAAGAVAVTLDRSPEPRHESVTAATVSDRRIDLHQYDAAADWRTGKTRGTRVTADGQLAFDRGYRATRLAGRTYDAARWTGPWGTPGFTFTELIASWSARTPGSSWIELKVRGRTAAGTATSWDTLARWASGDAVLMRTSGGAQADDGTTLATDTWRSAGLTAYQLRVEIHRQQGKRSVPRLDLATVMTSQLPAAAGPTSAPGVAKGIELPVPRYSQMAHIGHYPQWGGGGEAWCSPTSTSMVLGYYGRLPAPSSYSWVPRGHTDPWVDAAARATYDHAYRGTGNWPFNTAYAARQAGKAFVTRLRSLRDAEVLVKAGIPPIVSVAFRRGQLTGAPISASNGHLLVIVGFTRDGAVIANDPAAPSSATVRRVYDRAQFEKLWLEASGGMAYVVHDAAHPLPKGSSGSW
ncbi:peptidase C39 family protein [Nocardioides ginsengisoli]